MLVPCKAAAKNLSDFGLSHIPWWSSESHCEKIICTCPSATGSSVFCLLFFCSKLRLSFLKRKKHRAVEEDIHCKVGVKSIKGYTPPPASSCTLQALLEKHHPEVSKNPKSRLALCTTSVNLNGPNWNPAFKPNQQKTTKKSWASQVPKP